MLPQNPGLTPLENFIMATPTTELLKMIVLAFLAV